MNRTRELTVFVVDTQSYQSSFIKGELEFGRSIYLVSDDDNLACALHDRDALDIHDNTNQSLFHQNRWNLHCAVTTALFSSADVATTSNLPWEIAPFTTWVARVDEFHLPVP